MGRFSKLETDEKIEIPSGAQASSGVGRREEEPRDANHLCLRAAEEFLRGHYSKALQWYSRATQNEPTHLGAWTGQLVTLLAMGQKREALVWVRRALDVLPQSARLIALQGLIFAHTGMLQRGLQCSDYAMEAGGTSDAYAWMARGQILGLADNPHAQACIEKALETRGAEDWLVPALIGLFFFERRAYPLAEKYLAMAVHEHSTAASLWYHLGRAQLRQGKMQAAGSSLETALKLDPQFREAAIELDKLKRVPWLARVFRRFFSRG